MQLAMTFGAAIVVIDACLSHKLKRRTLGLFKTNSSTALVQKIAKYCASAHEVLQFVEEEEKRQHEEELHRQKHSIAKREDSQSQVAAVSKSTPVSSVNSLTRQARKSTSASGAAKSAAQTEKLHNEILSSNRNLRKRHMWLKCALIEKKLVDIVEYLAENATKYYEIDALMANCLSAQLLCSLLVGPSALEFSRSKTNNYYQYEEPSAEELIRRHKLSNPIACLCSYTTSVSLSAANAGNTATSSSVSNDVRQRSASFAQRYQQIVGRSLSSMITNGCTSSPMSTNSVDTGQDNSDKPRQEQGSTIMATSGRYIEASTSSPLSTCSQSTTNSLDSGADASASRNKNADLAESGTPANSQNVVQSQQQQHQLVLNGNQRRRPLALKANVATGALVTDCHHCSCKEIIEHQRTRGYSFRCKTTNVNSNSLLPANNTGATTMAGPRSPNINNFQQSQMTPSGFGPGNQQQECLSLWSPRILHETLHQNSKSSLLYAKNNVLLETQAHGLMAGYLSMHQTNSDLIIKWIPNHLINGGHQSSLISVDNQSGLHKHEPVDGTEDDDLPKAEKREKYSKSFDNNDEINFKSGSQQNDFNTNISSQQQSVGSSYLDLVVSLSVSQIVLIQCHFIPDLVDRGHQNATHQAVGDSNMNLVNKNLPDSGAATPTAQDQERLTEQDKQTSSNSMETLILVEVDGVQRAPFKFPKGGLRWFLSCLENGLHPHRYLELAIKPEGWTDWPWIDDFLVPPARSADEKQTQMTANEILHQSNSVPTKSAIKEPRSRFDILLKSLPPFKMLHKSVGTSRETVADLTSEGSNKPRCSSSAEIRSIDAPVDDDIEARANSSIEDEGLVSDAIQELSTAKYQQQTINYVYRIVSTQQHESVVSTPPLSAFSITSSSSSSFSALGFTSGTGRWSRLVSNNNSNNQTADQSVNHKSPHSLNGGQQRFRWSLSRLARFSSRCSGGSTSSSIGASSTTQSQTPSSTGGGIPEEVSQNNQQQLHRKKSLESTQDYTAADKCDELDNSSASLEANQSATTTSTLNQSKRDSSSELTRIEAKLDTLNKSSSRDELMALRDQSIQTLCESMRKQILARAFYGWLVHCRRAKIIRSHLMKLMKLAEGENHLIDPHKDPEYFELACSGLTHEKWNEFMNLVAAKQIEEKELSKLVNQLVYYGGIENNQLRIQVWPYLLGHYEYCDSFEMRKIKDLNLRESFEQHAVEWNKIEKVIKQRDNEILAANMARVERRKRREQQNANSKNSRRISETASTPTTSGDEGISKLSSSLQNRRCSSISDWQEEASLDEDQETDGEGNKIANDKTIQEQTEHQASQQVKSNSRTEDRKVQQRRKKDQLQNKTRKWRRPRLESTGSLGSDASITDQFGNNIHRIDKDVQRCDRHYWYFQDSKNLDKLRNIMCSYVWQHLDAGYVQGMCDLAAPFLVIFDDEFQAFCCFNQSMKRMVSNFPHGNAMDQHFENLKYLMQVLDPKLFEIMQRNGDYSHFYFCYRWLLLDFKRELAYEDVFRVWETIWSARHLISDHFVVFLALAMVRFYRDIIIENDMDFTDTIKFFNEMAERHDIKEIIELAQDCVVELESLIRS